MENFNKESDSCLKQSGFFDLGISLLILAMAGSAAYMTEQKQDEKMAALQEHPEFTMSRETESPDETTLSRLDSEVPGFAVE